MQRAIDSCVQRWPVPLKVTPGDGWFPHVPSWTASLNGKTILGIMQDFPALIPVLALGPGSGRTDFDQMH